MENPQSQAPVETAAPAAEAPTLEQIAKELSVEEQAQQFTSTVPSQPQYQPQTFQAPQYQAQYAPDPVTDPEGYRAFMSSQLNTVTQLNQTLQSVNDRMSNWEKTQQEQKIERDINTAVTKVNAKLNVDPFVTEALLQGTYRSDANFRRIWDNRDRNPGALEKALDVLSQKYVSQFSVKQDPKIAQNLQAAKVSQQTMATTQKPGMNDGVPQDPMEFQRYWDRLISGG